MTTDIKWQDDGRSAVYDMGEARVLMAALPLTSWMRVDSDDRYAMSRGGLIWRHRRNGESVPGVALKNDCYRCVGCNQCYPDAPDALECERCGRPLDPYPHYYRPWYVGNPVLYVRFDGGSEHHIEVRRTQRGIEEFERTGWGIDCARKSAAWQEITAEKARELREDAQAWRGWCTKCDGTGSFSRTICPRCEGTGEEPEEPRGRCAWCGGRRTGEHSFGHVCACCHGIGEEPEDALPKWDEIIDRLDTLLAELKHRSEL